MASGSVTAIGYQNRECIFEWTSSTSGNKTTINWTVRLAAGTSSEYRTSQCYFKVTTSGCTSSISSKTVLSYNTSRPNTGRVQIGSGSFTLTTTSATNSFTIALYFSTFYWDEEGEARYSASKKFSQNFSYTPPTTPTPTVYVWTGSAWKAATPYVWTGSAWKKATPYVWTGSAWKSCLIDR